MTVASEVQTYRTDSRAEDAARETARLLDLVTRVERARGLRAWGGRCGGTMVFAITAALLAAASTKPHGDVLVALVLGALAVAVVVGMATSEGLAKRRHGVRARLMDHQARSTLALPAEELRSLVFRAQYRAGAGRFGITLAGAFALAGIVVFRFGAPSLVLCVLPAALVAPGIAAGVRERGLERGATLFFTFLLGGGFVALPLLLDPGPIYVLLPLGAFVWPVLVHAWFAAIERREDSLLAELDAALPPAEPINPQGVPWR